VWLLLVISPPAPIPLIPPAVQVVLVNPYASPPLQAYGRVRDQLQAGDHAALQQALPELTGYLAYRVAQALAEDATLPAAERLSHYEQVLTLRLDDPLERDARRELHLRVGSVAAAAGETTRAVEAFTTALPHPEAIAALHALDIDALRRANAFASGRQHGQALVALDGMSAPSIEAPALRALGRHQEALGAYQRWLVLEPNNLDAREGLAWSLFALERFAEADAEFARLPGAAAAYGRGLVAGREGRIDDGVRWMIATGQAARMWIASGWLEQRDRLEDAIDLYLRIAASGDRTYADDAAYRALVLADRQNNAEAAALAAAAIPPGSFFDLLQGGTLTIPTAARTSSHLPSTSDATQATYALAQALLRAGDGEAARGEVLFAMRDRVATGELEDAIFLAQWLQQHGEYRHSTRIAQGLLAGARDDLRLWHLTYPRAHRASVEWAAETFGVEPAWIWAIMKQESAFAPFALSTSNAQGLMQVIPSTWTWLAELQREAPGDPFDPETNIRYGAYYLAWLTRYFDGDRELATASYNRGQGYIGRLFAGPEVAGQKEELYRFIDSLETREYLQIVSVNLEIYRALYF
jgi:soluble lytic murein transglycosylase